MFITEDATLIMDSEGGGKLCAQTGELLEKVARVRCIPFWPSL